MPIQRLTLFKVLNPSDIPAIQSFYETLFSTTQQRRDSVHPTTTSTSSESTKPYILSCKAYPLVPDARSQGYNLAASTQFASLEDVKYYDEQCEAHAELKAKLKGKVEPPPLPLVWEA